MKLPDAIGTDLKHVLSEHVRKEVSIENFSPASGGCINNGGSIQTSAGTYFIKWNDATRYPNMFDAEAKGLAVLRSKQEIRIPEVIRVGNVSDYQFLLLENIESHPPSKDYSQMLGRQLASLHAHSHRTFGLDHNNYMGSLQQHNTPMDSWIDFFIERRLEVQLRIGIVSGAIEKLVSRDFEKLYNQLPLLLSVEKPACLHGDLWSGNVITDERGHPCLIDPAVYYGHREVDLAMTQLFGGFDAAFYDAYQELMPTAPGLRTRLDIYNLYPLLVHVNLFGGGYLSKVKLILKKIL